VGGDAPGGQGRGHSRKSEQDAHAHAAAHATGVVAGPAGQAEQAPRTVGTGSQAPVTRRREVMERQTMTRNGSIWILTTSLAFTCVAAPARAQQISEARIHELVKQAADRVAKGEVGDAR